MTTSKNLLLAFATAVALIMGACVVESTTEDDDGSSASSGQPTSSGVGGSAGGSSSGGSGGIGGAEPPACDPYVPRPVAPETIIGPTGLQNKLVGLMDSAQTSLDLMMYQMGCSACLNGLVSAHNRGVKVRVLFDGDQYSNDSARSTLQAAGVEVRDAPAEFNHAHAKVMIIDNALAVVMSANMNNYSMSSERNYGVVDTSTEDLADLQAIFERDWAGSGAVDVSCTRLIVSPENAREHLLAFIDGAQQNLDFAVMYISDSQVKAAVKAKAASGVPVRVLLAHPEWIDENTALAAELQAAGIPAKFLYAWELHAKLVIADGVAWVGSVNMSYNSLENNREIGLLLTEPESATPIVQQFETDWSQGVTP
jgi:phosphatidylserine/phosphatidylglycerophosphate/cardiolipin synthase-like enzyme